MNCECVSSLERHVALTASVVRAVIHSDQSTAWTPS